LAVPLLIATLAKAHLDAGPLEELWERHGPGWMENVEVEAKQDPPKGKGRGGFGDCNQTCPGPAFDSVEPL